MNLPVLLLIFIPGWGLVLAAIMYGELRSVKRRRRDVVRMLSSAQVEVDEDTFQGLLQFARRRVVGSGVGCGVGMAVAVVAMATSVPGATGPTAGLFGTAICLVGVALGSALSGWTRSEVAADAPRVATLRPHGLGDYLLRRELVAQVAALGFGIAGVLTVVVLAYSRIIAAPVASVAEVLSALVILVSTLGFVLQRRLLRRRSGRRHPPTWLPTTSGWLAACATCGTWCCLRAHWRATQRCFSSSLRSRSCSSSW